MSHLATLINDLALILICAGVMTLLFKKLKQPLVLGYVVAGFLASPHMPYTPSVMDTANIQTWADIGVIFLLFALGLEFSFKKIVKVGGAAIIAACTIIFCMILLGIAVGTGFGWQRMDSIFLGGMIAMSSTTIIYKAFDDLGMRKKQFTGIVLSVLILEDILAIVLMVMLSTMAVRHNFEGTEMLESIGKLLFFLILWFVVGIYLIPELLKRCRKLMSEETLLIVSLGLCFGMVVMAAHTGFSAAFGAFIMGSILAETVEAESIERLVKPVKDLLVPYFCICGYDGQSCYDCGVCASYYCDYFGSHLGAVPVRNVGCAALRATVEDGDAVWIQFDADWGICFHHSFTGSFASCDERFLVSYCCGSFGHHHFPDALYDSLGGTGI